MMCGENGTRSEDDERLGVVPDPDVEEDPDQHDEGGRQHERRPVPD